MSFDEQPDADIHAECAAEIHKLQSQVKMLREAIFQSQYAIRHPFDRWKGDVESLALKLCHAALGATAPDHISLPANMVITHNEQIRWTALEDAAKECKKVRDDYESINSEICSELQITAEVGADACYGAINALQCALQCAKPEPEQPQGDALDAKPEQPEEDLGKISVSIDALAKLLIALSGHPHQITEFQVTRNLGRLTGDNPINILCDEYNAEIERRRVK